jgi:diaminopimelate decarboxylase
VSETTEKLKALVAKDRKKYSTPCFVYSVSQFERNYQELKEALGTQLIYSMKSNSCLDLIVRCGHVFEDGIEIASIGELNSLASGDGPRYINNPSADRNFIRAAIASKCTLVVDNLAQLALVAQFVGKRPIKPIMIRLNHETLSEFSPQSARIKPNHFGMDWQDTQKALEICQASDIQVAGFHVFKGSQSFPTCAMDTVTASQKIIEAFEKTLGYAISKVNLGGGFDANWREYDFDFEQYRSLLNELPKHIQILHESGRGIAASAGYYLTQVRYVKSVNEQHYAICDGGMAQNFLLANTETPFRRYETPIIIAENTGEPASDNLDSPQESSCFLVGTSCNKDDVIGVVKTHIPQPGDLALFENCGAYNANYTVSPFLTLPPAQAYLVE